MIDRTRDSRNHRYLYVYTCETPGGHVYRAYGHQLADAPIAATSTAVNLRKR